MESVCTRKGNDAFSMRPPTSIPTEFDYEWFHFLFFFEFEIDVSFGYRWKNMQS